MRKGSTEGKNKTKQKTTKQEGLLSNLKKMVLSYDCFISAFQGHLIRARKHFFRLNSLLFAKDLYMQQFYEDRMKWKSSCIAPRSQNNDEQSENYFSKG